MEVAKVIVSAVATLSTFLLGGFDLPIRLLLIALVIDFITGLIRSGIRGEINSSIGFKGLLKKVGKLCIVVVAVIVDYATNAQGAVRLFVIYYIMATELISVIENLGEADVPIPKKLKDLILKFKEDNDKESEDDRKRNR